MEITTELVYFILGIVAIVISILAMILSILFYFKGNELYLEMRNLLADVRETSGITKETTHSILDKVLSTTMGASTEDIVKKEVDKGLKEWKKGVDKELNEIKNIAKGSDIKDKIERLEFSISRIGEIAEKSAIHSSREIGQRAILRRLLKDRDIGVLSVIGRLEKSKKKQISSLMVRRIASKKLNLPTYSTIRSIKTLVESGFLERYLMEGGTPRVRLTEMGRHVLDSLEKETKSEE